MKLVRAGSRRLTKQVAVGRHIRCIFVTEGRRTRCVIAARSGTGPWPKQTSAPRPCRCTTVHKLVHAGSGYFLDSFAHESARADPGQSDRHRLSVVRRSRCCGWSTGARPRNDRRAAATVPAPAGSPSAGTTPLSQVGPWAVKSLITRRNCFDARLTMLVYDQCVQRHAPPLLAAVRRRARCLFCKRNCSINPH